MFVLFLKKANCCDILTVYNTDRCLRQLSRYIVSLAADEENEYLNAVSSAAELRICVNVEVALLGCL